MKETSCIPCFSFVQFPGISPTDTNVVVNGAVFPAGWTVAAVVGNNPLFFFHFGVQGMTTLCAHIVVQGTDITVTATNAAGVVISTGTPIIIHPPHAPH